MNQYSGLNENKQFLRGRQEVSRQRRRFRDVFIVMGFMVVLVSASLWIAAKYSTLRDVGYKVAELRDQNDHLRAEQDKLRAEVAALSRPERILPKTLALGMRPLGAEQVVEVRFAREIPQPGDADPELVARLDGSVSSR